MSALIKEKTCAFTGHRIISDNFDAKELKNVVNQLIDRHFDTFLIGMALGFDTLCFEILEEVRSEKSIKIIACVPCRDQNKFFNKKQNKEYERMISSADEVIYLSETYYEGCMFERNRFMVDNSDVLVAYLNFNRGGTYQTCKYAASEEKEIIYLFK